MPQYIMAGSCISMKTGGPWGDDESALYSITAALEYIGVSAPTFYKLIREHSVDPVAWGRTQRNVVVMMYHQVSLDKIIDAYDPDGHKTKSRVNSRENLKLRARFELTQRDNPLVKLRKSAAHLPPWDLYGINSDETEYDEYVALTEIYGIGDVERAMTVD